MISFFAPKSARIRSRIWSKCIFLWNCFFLSVILSLWKLRIEKRSLKGCLFLNFSFFFSFWPIKSADLPDCDFSSKIVPREYIFMWLSVDFCHYASTLRLFRHWEKDLIWISTLVMGARNTQVPFGNSSSHENFIQCVICANHILWFFFASWQMRQNVNVCPSWS